MKYFILTVTAMIVAVTSMSQNIGSGYVNIASVNPTPEQDKLMYVSPNDIATEAAGRTQKIVTGIDYIGSPIPNYPMPTYRMQHFLVECVANQADFSKGVTENVNLLNGAVKAMPVMPKRAKVVGLALPGYYDQGSHPNFVTNLFSYLFIKNLNGAPSLNPPYKEIAYSALLKEKFTSEYFDDEDDRYFYKPENEYLQAIPKANHKFRAIDSQDAEHPYVLDMMFDYPFQYDYDGDEGYIHLAIELSPADDDGVESLANNGYATYFYFPNTQSSFSDATIYHSYRDGNSGETQLNFYKGAQAQVSEQLINSGILGNNPTMARIVANYIFNFFNFQNNILPAFQLTYYTNDIRGTVLDPDGNAIQENTGATNVDHELQPNGLPLISLYDETAQEYIKPDGVETLNSMNCAEVNADGSFSFSNLDHTHVYTLLAASSTCGYQEKTINFDTGFPVQSAPMLKEINEANAFKNDLVCDIRMKQNQSVPTAIIDVAASASPVAVDYYNVAGVRSATPFSGVNIVVTHYSDGTTSTVKMIK